MLEVTKQFPVLAQKIHGERLAYLDSAASTQKPLTVIEAVNDCLQHGYSNVHRGLHFLSRKLSRRYDDVREKVADFIGAARSEEIVFTKGTTEGINLLASSLGETVLEPGDKVLITALEHHANIVPWQIACRRFGAELVVLPMNRRGVLSSEDFETYLDGVKIFAITQISNVLGTINDVAPLIAKSRARGIVTIVDGAQAIAHLAVDVQTLGCDFYVFSGHKLYGPTGVGVLYGRYEWLEKIPPYQSGGEMILSVSFSDTIYAPPPMKFEAGTPPIVEVIGLGAAIDWVRATGLEAIAVHEEALRVQTEERLSQFDGLKIYGRAPHKAAVISFTLENVHPHDAATVMDQCGVAVRAGHHCAEPVMRFFGIPASIRASFAAYNTSADIDQLIKSLEAMQEIFT